MLLSLRYNFLFIHIAKTGGTSVRSALNRYVWRDPYRILYFICSRLSHLSGHRLGVNRESVDADAVLRRLCQ